MTAIMQGRILVVDDEVANIEVLHAVLGSTYEILFATHGRQALEIARVTRPHLILLDVMMPEMDGFEVCKQLKADSRTSNIPVIFVTGLGDVEAETRGLEVGAVDYVTKPISPPVVRIRVRNQIELKRAREQLERLADTDDLTALANRRQFDRILDLEFRRHRRSGAPLSLLLIDVDQFKKYNDTYGHVAGDECLRLVAAVIKCTLNRGSDLAARYGGEEFAVILTETVHEGVLLVAERIRRGIADLRIPHASSPIADHVTASLGAITLAGATIESSQEIVALADAQLYRAKAEGRNRVAAAQPRECPACEAL